MAQLAEQLICNQQVIGSIPIVGFSNLLLQFNNGFDIISKHGWIPERPKGADCNLLSTTSEVRILLHPFTKELISWTFVVTAFNLYNAGWSSLEARRAHNPKVIGSNPVPATQFVSPDSSVGRAED